MLTNIKTGWEVPEGMQEYLLPTELVDFSTEIIQKKSIELLKGINTQIEVAIKIYWFVREIKYESIPLDTKASRVLEINKAECVAKATLLIALLRAVNIPARYHFVSIKRELLEGLFHPFLLIKPDFGGHGFCEVYLEGRWIKIEALWDTELFKIIKEKRLNCYDFTSGKFDWDGKTDIELDKKRIVKDLGIFASADEFLRDNPMQLDAFSKLFLPLGFFINNLHIDKIRRLHRQSR